MNRGKGHLPLTPCDRPGDYARVHGSMQAYNRWGCRCKVAREQRSAWLAAWRQSPNGRASIRRTNQRKIQNRSRVATVAGVRRAEREAMIIAWTRRGEPTQKIAAELGRSVRAIQRTRVKLRAEGRL